MSGNDRPPQLSAPTDTGLTGDEALVDAAQGEDLQTEPVAEDVAPEDPDLADEIAAQEVPQ